MDINVGLRGENVPEMFSRFFASFRHGSGRALRGCSGLACPYLRAPCRLRLRADLEMAEVADHHARGEVPEQRVRDDLSSLLNAC